MEEREAKRVTPSMAKRAMNGLETEEEGWVRIHRRPRRDLFSLHDSQDGSKFEWHFEVKRVHSLQHGWRRMEER